MKYVYPIVLTPTDGGYSVTAPDLPGCNTFGDTLTEAIEMAQDAVSMWLWDAENSGEKAPAASDKLSTSENAILNYILADTDKYRREHDNRAVKKTVSIPSWLNSQAEKANAPFSQILQEGLKQYLANTL